MAGQINLSNPQNSVTRAEVILLEVGIRLQQLLMLHPYAVHWREPRYDPQRYSLLIDTLRDRIVEATSFSTANGTALSDACHDLTEYWRDTVATEFNGTWVTPQLSSIPTQIEKIAALIDVSFTPTDRLAAWYRLGRIAADGQTDQTSGHWKLASYDAFQQHLVSLSISETDVYVTPAKTLSEDRYPSEFAQWRKLNAGILRLATIASASGDRAQPTSETSANPSTGERVATPNAVGGKPHRSKRSTGWGQARFKLVAALTQHHRYNEEASEPNFEAISLRNLARTANVSPATAWKFFKDMFEGYDNYTIACCDRDKLTNSLRMLNGEVIPKILFRPLAHDPAAGPTE